MLLAMLLSATISEPAGAGSLADFTAEIDRILLSGRPMPPALLLDLDRLENASDRMLAIVYLRRSGLMTGPEVPLERLLPSSAATATGVQHGEAGNDIDGGQDAD